MSDLLIQLTQKPGVSAIDPRAYQKNPHPGDIIFVAPSYTRWGRLDDKRRYIEDFGSAAGWGDNEKTYTAILNITDADITSSKLLHSRREYGSGNEEFREWYVNISALPIGVQTALQTVGYAEATIAEVGQYIINKRTAATFSPAPAPQPQPSGYLFQHPSAMQAQDITQGARLAAWNSFTPIADAALSYTPPARSAGNYDRTADFNYLLDIGGAIRDCGVRFAYKPNDVRFAQKAISLLTTMCVNPATRINPTADDGVLAFPIDLYVHMTTALYGASFVMDYWETYNSTTHGQFKTWCTTILASMSGNHEGANRWNWLICFRASLASLVNDKSVLNTCYSQHSDVVFGPGLTPPARRILADGTLSEDRDRTTSLEGLGYSMFALTAMGLLCEIARLRGVDIWRVDNAMEYSLDTHAPWVLDTTTWPYTQNNPAGAYGQAAPIYTMAYNIWPKAEYLGVINFIGTPKTHRVMGPHSLTHGN